MESEDTELSPQLWCPGREVTASCTHQSPVFCHFSWRKYKQGTGEGEEKARKWAEPPKVEQKTNPCSSCGNFPNASTRLAHPSSSNGSVSMSMAAVDNVALLPSAVILHYFELAGLSSGTILIPFMSWEFWRWASTAACYKLEYNICCTEPQKLYRITERESKLEWKLLTSNCY